MNTTWNDSRFGPGSYEFAAQEDRSAARAQVHIEATLRPAGGEPLTTHVRNLSRAGFTATSSTRLDTQTLCWLTIAGFGAMQAEVIWWQGGLFGAAFANLLDPDLYQAIVQSAR